MTKNVTIYDHLGRPVRRQQLSEELAAPTMAGVRTIWDNSIAAGLTPYSLGNLLQSAAQGDAHDYLTLAEEIEERDMHYACEISKRKLAVSRLPISVEAAGDDSGAVKMADAVRSLTKKGGFRGLLKDLLDGIAKGYSVAEIIWDRSSALWYPGRYAWRDPRFFTFDLVSRSEVRLLDDADMAQGIPLEPYKFIVHLPHIKTGIPIRGGLARVAAWAWICKSYTVKDWLAFAEVFGMPLRVGKYNSGAKQDEINILKMAVANLGSDAAAVIPESMLIELIERKGQGGENVFKILADYLDAQVSRLILGQTATTQGTPGKLGNEDAQVEVRHDIRDDDGEQLAETINRDLVKPFIDLNFGPQENYPQLLLQAPEREDVTVLTNALKELVPLGLEVDQSVVRDKLGLPDPAEGAKLLTTGQNQPPAESKSGQNSQCPACGAKALNFVSSDESPAATLDNLADNALAANCFDPMLGHVQDLMSTSNSLEEFRDGLLDIYADIDDSQLGNTMAAAMLTAELSGRFDSQKTAGAEKFPAHGIKNAK